MTDSESSVVCAICGIQRRRLLAHIKTTHQLTRDEYHALHPGSLLDAPGSRDKTPETRARMAEKAKLRWSTAEARAEQSRKLVKVAAAWRGKPLSPEHRKAISQGGLGVPHDVSPENRKRMGEQGRQVLVEIRQHPGYSEKLSRAMKRRYDRGDVVGFMAPAHQTKGLASRIRNGTLSPQGGGRGICGFRAGIPHYCRSTLEANFARILLHLGVAYNYEPRVFRLPVSGHYTPDFYLMAPFPDGLLPSGWVELKGWRLKDGTVPTQAKVEEFTRVTGSPLQVICARDPLWVTLQDKYSGILPGWETPTRNLRTHPQMFAAGSLGTVMSLCPDQGSTAARGVL